jgi:hypothetical protein
MTCSQKYIMFCKKRIFHSELENEEEGESRVVYDISLDMPNKKNHSTL